MNRAKVIPAGFVACRDVGHSWRPHDVLVESSRFVRVLACSGCGALRRQVVLRSGRAVSNSYSYPPGYVMTGGRLSQGERNAVRLRGLAAFGVSLGKEKG